MSRKTSVAATRGGENEMRSYPGAWKGELVLVCRKCQKRLKHSGGTKQLGKMSKTLKKRALRQGHGLELKAVGVSCLKMCPKGGVTVCTGAQLARHECSILRSIADVDALIDQYARAR
jgi:predicted metal-binding protein